ncbi:hypothetical protein HN014_07985 [Aquimarina sp. TRL1]|uniref:AAA family ATPase n=1 Tax=Aquimarina sp. (strain TRL1) TaxID=2736252 RepID=UPI00158F3EF5|nr:AAA family ATPase [Aquimarina sp. TRL1]QKX04857.1 hypothetical protein HN014_07985 [Aquimarina sp. TRL1]
MELKTTFKEQVISEIITRRENFSGSDSKYAKSLDLSPSVYSRLKNGESHQLISDSLILQIARKLNIQTSSNTWKLVKTSVYQQLESNLNFCKQHTESMILIDDCGIGKSACSRHIVQGMHDSFYIDCSQAKTKQRFVRYIAKVVGINDTGRYHDVKENLKYYINAVLVNPLFVLDDVGYLDYSAFLEIPELWNSTEDRCSWYMIGDESLKKTFERSIENQKKGFRAIKSRFLDEYISFTPKGEDKRSFLSELYQDVAYANVKDKSKVNKIVKMTLAEDSRLRYLKKIVKINNNI